MKDVRASVWRPRALRHLSRYGVTLSTDRRTELSSPRTAALGLKVSASGDPRRGEAGGELGRVGLVLWNVKY